MDTVRLSGVLDALCLGHVQQPSALDAHWIQRHFTLEHINGHWIHFILDTFKDRSTGNWMYFALNASKDTLPWTHPKTLRLGQIQGHFPLDACKRNWALATLYLRSMYINIT